MAVAPACDGGVDVLGPDDPLLIIFMDGDVTDGVVMAGQIAGMVKKEQTCKEMIEEMMEQAEKLLAR